MPSVFQVDSTVSSSIPMMKLLRRMPGEPESSLRERRLSSCSLERNFKMAMSNQLSSCPRKRLYYSKLLKTIQRSMSSEELETDGSSEDPETTFPQSKFKSLREEEPFPLTPMRVSTSETSEQEKSEKSRAKPTSLRLTRLSGKSTYQTLLKS